MLYPYISSKHLKNVLKNLLIWSYIWKIIDISKKSQELIVFSENFQLIHSSIIFNTVAVTRTPYKYFLRMYFDEQLSFNNQINVKNSKLSKSVTIKVFEYTFKKLPVNYLQISYRSAYWLLWYNLRLIL